MFGATSDDGFTVDVNFGEQVSGFTQDDLVLTNATVTNFNDFDGTNLALMLKLSLMVRLKFQSYK